MISLLEYLLRFLWPLAMMLVMAGCKSPAVRQSRTVQPPPPLPAMAFTPSSESSMQAEAVIGPPQIKQLKLLFTKGALADSTEIWSTVDLNSWQLEADVTGEEYPFFASGSYRFFKIRSKQVETYSVSNYHTGQWEQVAHTNYSTWAK